MPGNQVKDWGQYHALRKENYSKESAAKIVNAKSKTPHPTVEQFPRGNGGGNMNINPPGPQARGVGANKQRVTDRWNAAKGNNPDPRAKAKHAAVARLRSKYNGL